MAGSVDIVREGALAWVVFDHPERRNAMSAGMWTGLVRALRELEADEQVRVIVMRGAGEQAFVSGADISQFAPARGEAAGDAGDRGDERIDPAAGNVFELVEAVTKPVIAMIHGYCIGGGLALALCADMRYSADDGVFAIPAARLGVGYGFAAIEQLARTVGLSSAREILMSARRYDAAEGLAMGLVDRVLPKAELEEFVREMAGRIAENAPLTVRSVKLATQQIKRGAHERDLEAVDAAIRDCFESADFAEGVAAFMQKRRPDFSGR
jgi:enoyl-CoA hydratase/carnithine racemase